MQMMFSIGSHTFLVICREGIPFQPQVMSTSKVIELTCFHGKLFIVTGFSYALLLAIQFGFE